MQDFELASQPFFKNISLILKTHSFASPQFINKNIRSIETTIFELINFTLIYFLHPQPNQFKFDQEPKNNYKNVKNHTLKSIQLMKEQIDTHVVVRDQLLNKIIQKQIQDDNSDGFYSDDDKVSKNLAKVVGYEGSPIQYWQNLLNQKDTTIKDLEQNIEMQQKIIMDSNQINLKEILKIIDREKDKYIELHDVHLLDFRYFDTKEIKDTGSREHCNRRIKQFQIQFQSAQTSLFNKLIKLVHQIEFEKEINKVQKQLQITNDAQNLTYQQLIEIAIQKENSPQNIWNAIVGTAGEKFHQDILKMLLGNKFKTRPIKQVKYSDAESQTIQIVSIQSIIKPMSLYEEIQNKVLANSIKEYQQNIPYQKGFNTSSVHTQTHTEFQSQISQEYDEIMLSKNLIDPPQIIKDQIDQILCLKNQLANLEIGQYQKSNTIEEENINKLNSNLPFVRIKQKNSQIKKITKIRLEDSISYNSPLENMNLNSGKLTQRFDKISHNNRQENMSVKSTRVDRHINLSQNSSIIDIDLNQRAPSQPLSNNDQQMTAFVERNQVFQRLYNDSHKKQQRLNNLKDKVREIESIHWEEMAKIFKKANQEKEINEKRQEELSLPIRGCILRRQQKKTDKLSSNIPSDTIEININNQRIFIKEIMSEFEKQTLKISKCNQDNIFQSQKINLVKGNSTFYEATNQQNPTSRIPIHSRKFKSESLSIN